MDEYLTPEAGVVAAATAVLLSPRVRGVLRRGAVYGLAGVLMAGDTLVSFKRGVERGARGVGAKASDEPVETADVVATVAAAGAEA